MSAIRLLDRSERSSSRSCSAAGSAAGQAGVVEVIGYGSAGVLLERQLFALVDVLGGVGPDDELRPATRAVIPVFPHGSVRGRPDELPEAVPLQAGRMSWGPRTERARTSTGPMRAVPPAMRPIVDPSASFGTNHEP